MSNVEALTDCVQRLARGELSVATDLADHAEYWASPHGRGAAAILANSPYFPDMAERLVELGVPASDLLVSATDRAPISILERLLEQGADPNYANTAEQTPLMNARDAEVARLLIAKGADPSVGRYLSMAPIHVVALGGRLDVLRLLAEHGCDLDDASANFDGAATPLMCASFRGSFDVVRYLLSRGVDIDRQSRKNGKTALHFAIERGQFQVARLLVEKGAKLGTPSKTGATPLHAAIAKGKSALGMAAFLVERGAPLDAQDKNGLSPLMLALTKRQSKLVRLLVARGADLSLTLTKAKKVGKTKLAPGATTRDVAAAVGCEEDLEQPEEHTFEKERREAFGDMPPLDLVEDARDEAGASGDAATDWPHWGKRLWTAFGDLPEGLDYPKTADRYRLRASADCTAPAERRAKIVKRVRDATKHELSAELLSLYESNFEVRIHYHAVDGGFPFARFQIYPLDEVFFGPDPVRRKKPFDAHRALGLSKGVCPELERYFLLAGEEYGETLLSLANGKETLHFMLASEPGRPIPMTVSFAGYLEALLSCCGMHGWQGYFLTEPDPKKRFEEDLARFFGEQTLERFLSLSRAERAASAAAAQSR